MKKLLILMPVILLLSACGQEAPAPEVSEIPSELFTLFQPIDASAVLSPIPELRMNVSPGDEVVFMAKVMGSETPFVEGRALMVVGDEGTITSCDLMAEDDHCKTPWDACCDTRTAVLAGTATIQVLDAEGKVLRHGFRGVEGLKELSRVRVRGIVAPMSNEKALIVNATAIEVL